MKGNEPIYRVIFAQEGKTYELYARYISEETMLGFIEVDQLLFLNDQVLVDPSEEKLKAEFKDVERIYIPMHAILRIDEVLKTGHPRIKEITKDAPKSNVWHFPSKKSPAKKSDE